VVAACALALLAAGSQTAPAVAQQTDPRPNIVVIQTDDQTLDSLRFMPNVDRFLVKQGVTFESSFASFPLCCPSRATLLTGQYAHNHGVLGNNPPLGGYDGFNPTSTLPVWLQGAGYHTSFVGKYLNGYGDEDNKTVVPPGWSDWRGAVRKPGTGTLAYLDFLLNENGTLVEYPPTHQNYLTDVFTRKAVGAVQRGSASGQPFFLWLAHFAPHAGLPVDPDDVKAPGATLSPVPAARHRGAFAEEPLPRPRSFDEVDSSDKPRAIRSRARLSLEQKLAVEHQYRQRLESLLAVDEGVEQVVEALRSAGELANTLIVFTSDNGFLHGEHRVLPDRGKSLPYEPSARVPLVIRGPAIPKGKRVRDLVANVDLAPTFLALANVRSTPGRVMDGRSLLPLMRDPLADFGRDILFESDKYTALRTDRYVYVSYRKRERELYDLKVDPFQLRSRHADAKLRDVRYELARRLSVLGTCFGDECREEPRLALRLAALPGGSVRAEVTGRDSTWVEGTRYFVGGKQVASDARAPYRVSLPPALFTGTTITVRANVRTTDGRSVTFTKKLARLQ
jgi:N-acetylglucosamine-6-sulfatase